MLAQTFLHSCQPGSRIPRSFLTLQIARPRLARSGAPRRVNPDVLRRCADDLRLLRYLPAPAVVRLQRSGEPDPAMAHRRGPAGCRPQPRRAGGAGRGDDKSVRSDGKKQGLGRTAILFREALPNITPLSTILRRRFLSPSPRKPCRHCDRGRWTVALVSA